MPLAEYLDGITNYVGDHKLNDKHIEQAIADALTFVPQKKSPGRFARFKNQKSITDEIPEEPIDKETASKVKEFLGESIAKLKAERGPQENYGVALRIDPPEGSSHVEQLYVERFKDAYLKKLCELDEKFDFVVAKTPLVPRN